MKTKAWQGLGVIMAKERDLNEPHSKNCVICQALQVSLASQVKPNKLGDGPPRTPGTTVPTCVSRHEQRSWACQVFKLAS